MRSGTVLSRVSKCGFKVNRRGFGEISDTQLRAEIDYAFERWLERHPELRHGSQWFTNVVRRATTPEALAKAFLAIPTPKRGLLTRMCVGARLDYKVVHGVIVRLRKEKRELEAA